MARSAGRGRVVRSSRCGVEPRFPEPVRRRRQCHAGDLAVAPITRSVLATGQEAGPEHAGPEQAGTEQAGTEQAGTEQAGTERPG